MIDQVWWVAGLHLGQQFRHKVLVGFGGNRCCLDIHIVVDAPFLDGVSEQYFHLLKVFAAVSYFQFWLFAGWSRCRATGGWGCSWCGWSDTSGQSSHPRQTSHQFERLATRER